MSTEDASFWRISGDENAFFKRILDRKIAKTKLKHMGRPEDVAETILYLASDASRHITGQIIRIDGGKGI